MPPCDQQLHGYRNGHELLSATIKLPKTDQDLLDRLSDVAGPLGPGERFSPYLTCYPLPSGSHFVIARTWQDLDAPRAGCVRTRSLLTPMIEWMNCKNIISLVELATASGPTQAAAKCDTNVLAATPLPAVEVFTGTELIEALFLEDRVPIVIFDAERPEAISIRLLTAFWPAIRRNFSISTFCRSPRMISGRSFDLVFAPKDARSRFGEWQGRRIDGRRHEIARHPWSEKIVDKIFNSPKPSLSSLDVIGEMLADEKGSEAALRVSLLWDELQRKLETSPNAALGLLDIANTRVPRNIRAINELEPALTHAATRATTSMEPNDAWRFLSALIDKLGDLHLSAPATKSIRAAAIELAAAHPSDAISSLSFLISDEQQDFLTCAVGDGLSRVLDVKIAGLLQNLDGTNLLGLMVGSPKLAEKSLRFFPDLSTALVVALKHVTAIVRDKVRRCLLRFLVEDRHAELAEILIADLDTFGLVEEVTHLYYSGGFKSESMREIIVERARQAEAVSEIRDTVMAFGEETGVNAMVDSMMRPIAADLEWVLKNKHISAERRLALTLQLVMNASNGELRAMLESDHSLSETVGLFTTSSTWNVDALAKIAANVMMEPEILVPLSLKILPSLTGRTAAELAVRALEAALPGNLRFGPSNAVDILLGMSDRDISGARILRIGLAPNVSSSVASRNLIAFNQAPPAVRSCVLMAIEEMATDIVGRYRLDISFEAVVAAASLLWDSDSVNHRGFLGASANLLPFLLEARKGPASPLIAAAFPPVYRELQQGGVADFLSFAFIFLDWDRCKVARRQLVDAFVRSDWRPTDIALAAARAGDAERILAAVMQEAEGKRLIGEIERDLEFIPSPWRSQVGTAIREIREKKSRFH